LNLFKLKHSERTARKLEKIRRIAAEFFVGDLTYEQTAN